MSGSTAKTNETDRPSASSAPDGLLSGRIEAAVRRAIVAALGEACADADPIVRPAGNPKFGDYQANAAMGLAKRLNAKPRDVAEKIADALTAHGASETANEPPASATEPVSASAMKGGAEASPEAGLFEKVQVAGPGFINLTLQAPALAGVARAMLDDPRLGVAQAQGDAARRVVVDYASPNLAKEMHIGHLRSTIIGDAIARVLAFQGHEVIRQNHIGDWGTQFGMLLEHLIDTGWTSRDDQSIGDLNLLYQEAKKRDDADPAFAERARRRVVALQGGDPDALRVWSQLIEESKRHMAEVFARLGVLLTEDDIRGESFYNDMLEPTTRMLLDTAVAEVSEGAVCFFPDRDADARGRAKGDQGKGRKDDDDDDDAEQAEQAERPTPLIVRKSDGGYGYAATDLSAFRYRVGELGADRLVYVVDARQRQHFADFFAAARKAGWDVKAPERAQAVHVAFGTILGSDRRPFKTREGGTVRLTDVLDEAQRRAEAVIAEKNPELPEDERAEVAAAVGIGAVKYADLSNDRLKDYVFDYDRMLAFDGNTAPYLQYAYVRIASIFRKAELAMPDVDAAAIAVSEPAERALVLKAAQFGDVVASVGESLEPHRLCTFLYELATAYHQFNQQCRVLAEDDAVRSSRLALCALVARVLKQGLGLLGIATVERM